MKRVVLLGGVLSVVCASALAGDLQFTKERLGDSVYEAACVFDANADGHPDILTGEIWLPGPDFKTAHKFRELLYTNEYYDDFGAYPVDVDGDGDLDILTAGWFGKSLRWCENPGGAATGMWNVHLVEECGSVERPLYVDVDGNGTIEAVPNLPGGPLIAFELVRDAAGKGTAKFARYELFAEKQGHGLGFGDINGDGRNDFILGRGWLEAPEDRFGGAWPLHAEFDVGHASVPILVHDVNGDGRNDLIVGMGHDFGLAWWEQGEADGKRTWTKHDIETDRSQFHEMALADLDKDGRVELITGKRYRAHNGKDPGSDMPVGLYRYTIDGGKFVRQDVDYGAPGKHSGAGIYLWIADVDGNGWDDIVAPGKEGLFLFKNQGLK